MATWYPLAVRKPIVRNFGGKRPSTRGIVNHVDAGAAASLQGWFNNPTAGASSHFYVKYDGTVEQYVDADLIAWTQRAGNLTCVGIETQGKGDGEWTPAQFASLVALNRWLCERYGIPKVDMRNSLPSSRGMGYHGYGIDPWRVPGGEVWGPRGKVCPGIKRKAQFPSLVAAVAGGITIPVSDKPSTPPGGGESQAQIIARLNAGFTTAWIAAIQEKLNRLGYSLATDGVRGPATQAAVRDFQGKHGLVQDGLPGPATNAKLDALLAPKGVVKVQALQQAVRATADNSWGPDTDKRLEAVRAASTLHGRRFPEGVKYTQAVVGARADGDWGPNSRKAHDATVANIQRALGVTADGQWGPATEAAYLAARKSARNF